MADKDKTPDAEPEAVDHEPSVGFPHGYVDANGETIAYEYDEDKNFIGWHKEPAAEEKN